MRRILPLIAAALAACGVPEAELSPADSTSTVTQASTAITVGGQQGWLHDEGFSYGVFHTFDGLRVAGLNDTPRKVHVFIPRNYATSGLRYPVVYMNDGNTAFFPGGAANKSWRVGQTLSELKAAGRIRDVIVVAIHPLDRNREYTHVFWSPGYACCGLDGYTQYVADSVKGWIDTHYRTLPERQNTAIVGSSHGGLAAFYMANRRPDRFGLAGALSSSFWVGLDLINVGQTLAGSELIRRTGSTLGNRTTRPRLWIDWGLKRDGGYHNSVIEELATSRGREMVGLLRNTYGYSSTELAVHEDPIGGHDEDAWAWRFRLFMERFYPRL